uniref:Uncharacterized protein n=1 Tax=Anopheles atroparvus TaxID=41427 RepID=A0A182IK55_ANOAO
MAYVCFACANDLSPDTDASRCVICETWFHNACTKIPCSILAGIKQYAYLHWSCPGCTKALSNPRSKALKDIGVQAGFQSALGALVEALKEAIVQPLTSEMHSLVKSSTAHSSCTGSNVAASQADRTSPVAQSHRQFTYADTLRRTPAPEHVVITGTNAASPNLLATPQRFWLHIMGLANTITVEQVTASVSRRLVTEDVLAFFLLGRGVDPSSRRALSFKVRIPESCREKALRSDSWPVGVRVREFTFAPRQESRFRAPELCESSFRASAAPLTLNADRHCENSHNRTLPHSGSSSSASLIRTLAHTGSRSPSPPRTTAPPDQGIVATPRRSPPPPCAPAGKSQRVLTRSQNLQKHKPVVSQLMPARVLHSAFTYTIRTCAVSGQSSTPFAWPSHPRIMRLSCLPRRG